MTRFNSSHGLSTLPQMHHPQIPQLTPCFIWFSPEFNSQQPTKCLNSRSLQKPSYLTCSTLNPAHSLSLPKATDPQKVDFLLICMGLNAHLTAKLFISNPYCQHSQPKTHSHFLTECSWYSSQCNDLIQCLHPIKPSIPKILLFGSADFLLDIPILKLFLLCNLSFFI